MRVSKQTRRIAALVLAVFMALTSPVSSLADDDLVTIIPQETSAESVQPAGEEAETAVESESGQPEETTLVTPETETEAVTESVADTSTVPVIDKPDTGDYTDFMPWALLLAAGMAGCLGLLMYVRKKETARKS